MGKQGMIRLECNNTKSQKEDILTKSLSGQAHAACARGLGLWRPRNDEESPLRLYTVEEKESSDISNKRQGENGWQPVATADLYREASKKPETGRNRRIGHEEH